jgi:hypothetical protein
VIDFRYHLVSIVAVFLALALGIVLGSTELRGAALSALDKTTSQLGNQNAALRAERTQLQAQAQSGEAFAQAVEPKLLASLLTGKRLVIIAEPGAQDSVISGINQAAKDAGATITGQISLGTASNDTSDSTVTRVDAMTQSLVSNGGTLSAAALSGTTAQQAAQLLASTILTTNSQASTQPSASAETVLKGYASVGYLTTSGTPAVRAQLAIVVTPANTATDGSASATNAELVTLADAFGAASSATVVAGSEAGSSSGSAIAALRSSSTASKVSSVDNADSTIGQIATIEAVASQLAGGKANSYGLSQNGANAVAPTPVAAATPTPSTTATKKHGK